MDLNQRDMSAIAYSKSLLLDGDTLVHIDYPGNQQLCDPAGFKLSSQAHVVHSEKLLATGSAVFEKLLSDRYQQRAQKRAGYTSTNPLPVGIKYIIDLTPPVEGDEAVELTSDLSCSLGVRYWARAGVVCDVDPKLIGGRDEFVRPQNYSINEEDPSLSQKDDRDVKAEEIPEYCPIRHRAGIERLLRIIEGQDPRLDSAPKILTLSVLGKYFDCKEVVAGFIESWILTEPNTRFIEVLPEASFKIGHYVNSKMIVEAAFAVLVSEGAFRVASRMNQPLDADKTKTNQFGRLREDINEDELNRIQAAANDFQSRINGAASSLIEPTMSWFEQLSEFRKIMDFEAETSPSIDVQNTVETLVQLLRHYVRGRIMSVLTQQILPAQNAIANAHRRVERYLEPYMDNFEYLYDTLTNSERYLTRFYWDMLHDLRWNMNSGSNMAFDHELCSLSRQINEEMALATGIIKVTIPDLIKAQHEINNIMLLEMQIGNFYKFGVPLECFHTEVPDNQVEVDDFWNINGKPSPKQFMDPLGVNVTASGYSPNFERLRFPIRTKNSLKGTLSADSSGAVPPWTFTSMVDPPSYIESNATERNASVSVRVPLELNASTYDTLPFFSLEAFLTQVGSHISDICNSMLKDRYFGFRSITDTLLCMSGEELKYLPLWAGGNEDGTGGVFEKLIPPAAFGGAPNGPGPAYHTGLSIFSQSSSIVDVGEDDDMTEVGTINTSVAVENGFLDHLDRRVILSDVGTIDSDAPNEYEAKANGGAVAQDEDEDEDEDDFMLVSEDEDEDFAV